MTDQKKPEQVSDEALEDAQGGLNSFGNDMSTLKRRRKGDGLMSFGNDATTLIDDDPQDVSLIAFGNDGST